MLFQEIANGFRVTPVYILQARIRFDGTIVSTFCNTGENIHFPKCRQMKFYVFLFRECLCFIFPT